MKGGFKLISDILSVVQTLLDGYQKIEGDTANSQKNPSDSAGAAAAGSLIEDLVNQFITTASTTTTTKAPIDDIASHSNTHGKNVAAWIGFILFIAFDLLICCCIVCSVCLGIAAFIYFIRQNGSPLKDRKERSAKGGKVIKEDNDSGGSGKSDDGSKSKKFDEKRSGKSQGEVVVEEV